MPIKAQIAEPSFVRRTVALVSAFALVACSGSGVSTGANDPTTKKDEASSTSDDQADKPASLSGSYLTDHMSCVVPKVVTGDKYVSACCVLEDSASKRVKLKGLPNDTFKVALPIDKSIPAPKIEAVNLTSFDNQACHVVYRARLTQPAASAGLALDAAPKLDPKASVKGFLLSIPLFKKAQASGVAAPLGQNNGAASKSLSGGMGKKAGGLSLFDRAFRLLDSASTAAVRPVYKTFADTAPGSLATIMTKISNQNAVAVEADGVKINPQINDAALASKVDRDPTNLGGLTVGASGGAASDSGPAPAYDSYYKDIPVSSAVSESPIPAQDVNFVSSDYFETGYTPPAESEVVDYGIENEATGEGFIEGTE